MEDRSLKNETFLSVVERYLEENGSDALEKLIANKYKDYSSKHHAEEIKPTDTSDEAGRITPNQTQCEGSGHVWEDITVMEHMAKHEAAEPKQVKSVKENPIIIEQKMTGLQVKELVVPADAEEIKLPEVISPNRVQTEWTCALCQMTTTSEQNMKSHLNGRKHKSKYEALKICEQTPKSNGSLPVPTKSNQLNLEQVKHAAAAQPFHSTNEAAEPKEVKSVKEHPIQIEKKTTGVQTKDTAFPAEAKEIKLPEIDSVKNVKTEWTCAVCQVTTTSKGDLKCHLLGTRHRIKCEELKRTTKTERNPPSTSNMPELKQEQVKHALAAQYKNSTNKKLKENVQLGATTGQHQRQTQVKNAGGATHNSKLWCSFCDIRCPDEIAMAAHLNGKKHLAKLQERMSLTTGTWALNYANMQFYQGI